MSNVALIGRMSGSGGRAAWKNDETPQRELRGLARCGAARPAVPVADPAGQARRSAQRRIVLSVRPFPSIVSDTISSHGLHIGARLVSSRSCSVRERSSS